MVRNDIFQIEQSAGSAETAALAQLAVMCPRSAAAVYTYALHLAELLDAQICRLTPDQEPDLPQLVERSDLLVYQPSAQSRLKSWFYGPPASRVVSRLPVSVLVVKQPRWPLKKILLLTRGRLLDYAAATWVAQLARPILAEIAVLAVQPYLAATNSQAMFGQGVETWLASDTPLGQQLRHILNGSEIAPRQLHLQFRGGSPERQMRQAVIEAQPDLIVIAAEAGDWCERRVLGQLVKPLLQQVDRPVLVAKSGFFSG